MRIKFKRGLAGCLLVVMLGSLAACGNVAQRKYEISSYQGQLEEGQVKSDYNTQLFYRNDKKTTGADPFVLDNTAVDGYYYQYVTEGSLFC